MKWSTILFLPLLGLCLCSIVPCHGMPGEPRMSMEPSASSGFDDDKALVFDGTLEIRGSQAWIHRHPAGRLLLEGVDGSALRDYHGQSATIEGKIHRVNGRRVLRIRSFALSGSLLEKTVEEIAWIYNQPIPRPPKVAMDVPRILQSLETGDLVIENPRMNPHWYIVVSTLFPGSRYVHGGMAVKGHALIAVREKIAAMTGNPLPFVTWRRFREGGNFPWQYLPEPAIRPDGLYIVSPDMHRPDRATASGTAESVCTTIAMAAEDVLADPRFAYTAKHVQVLRPPVRTQQQMDIILLYLGYHLTQESAYDMAFSILEPDLGFTVSSTGAVAIDWDAPPPTVYCTELPWRAFAKAGIRSRTTTMNPLLTQILRFLPLIPAATIEAWCGPQVPPEVFRDDYTVDWDGQATVAPPELIYANEPPPPPLEVIRSLSDSIFKRLYLSVFITLGWCRP